MSHISESGVLVRSSILFRSKRVVKINSSLLDKIFSNNDVVYNVSKTIVGSYGRSVSEIDLLNLDENERLKLRKLIHSWEV